MNETNYIKKRFSLILLGISFLFSYVISFAQTDTTGTKASGNSVDTSEIKTDVPLIMPAAKTPKAKFEADFIQKEILLNKGQIVSNTLRISNNSNEKIYFNIDINAPAKWSSMLSNSKAYELAANDSIFIPIRIIPKTIIKGNTKYVINAFILDEEGEQLGSTFCFVSSKKTSSWEIYSNPGDKIYFLNGETTTAFSFNVLNTGNEKQDILLTLKAQGFNYFVTDTNDRIVNKPYFNLSLEPNHDTTLFYKMSYVKTAKNYNRVDIDNHKPSLMDEEKRFSLLAQSAEPRQSSPLHLIKKSKKVDFIKLVSEKTINPYSGSTVPLIMEANVNNVLSRTPVLNLNLRGNTLLNNGANLIYFSQTDYTSNYYNKKLLLNSGYYLGYFDKKYSVQIGDLSGAAMGLQSYGKGIKADYQIDSRNRIGAFYIKNPRVFTRSRIESYGVVHDLNLGKGSRIKTTLGQSHNSYRKVTTTGLNVIGNFSIVKNHSVGVTVASTFSKFDIPPAGTNNPFGYFLRSNYSGLFIDKKLGVNLAGNYTTKYFGSMNNERLLFTNLLRYNLSKKWKVSLNNTYNSVKLRTGIQNEQLNNMFNVFTNTPVGAFQPFAFYNFSNFSNFRFHSRGLGLNYNRFNLDNNFRVATSIRAGYNKAVDFPDVPNYFIFQFSNFLTYRNVSFNVRYNYGPIGMTDQFLLVNKNINPQSVFLNLQHQYIFSNTHFILQTSANYSYFNQFYKHNFGIFPDLYYYTNSGWRFRLTAGYNITSSNVSKSGFLNSYNTKLPSGEEEDKITVNKGFNLGVGVRKEFGIPVPFSKVKNHTVDFVAFLDVNGNHIKDKNEEVLENVVIKVADNEILTNEKGKGKLINIGTGIYPFRVFSLVDLKGWFPYVEDTIMIDKTKEHFVPFVRGIKVYGGVIMDREKYIANNDEPFDLSRIKITAVDGKTYNTLTGFDGSFEFYLPVATYVITMDEKILGDKFSLVKNNFELVLDDKMESIYVSFYIVEKKRKVIKKKFGATSGSTEGSSDSQKSGSKDGTTAPQNKPATSPVNQNNPSGAKPTPASGNPKTQVPSPAGTNKSNTGNTDKSSGNNQEPVELGKSASTPANLQNEQFKKAKDAFLANTTPASSLKGLVYTVQIGAFALPLNPSAFDGFADLISEELPSGLIRISTARFNSASEAETLQQIIIENGFPGAFVIAYLNGIHIPLSEAEKIKK